MAGYGLEDMIKSEFFLFTITVQSSSETRSCSIHCIAETLGSGIFVYWFILGRFCNGTDCIGSNMGMLVNDEFVKMLEATVIYFNILSHGFSVGDEEENSCNAHSGSRHSSSG